MRVVCQRNQPQFRCCHLTHSLVNLKMSEFVSEQLVRRYLISHNYSRTLAAFDGESSSDNLSDCFQPSKIMDNISRAIAALDCKTLGNIWKGLEDCFSSQLDRRNSAKFESLKAYTFKALLCEAVKSKQMSCITNFFSNQNLFDLSSSMWIHWSALPFVKEPAKHNLFSRYFTKTWLDVLFMSLSNFLCALFLSLPDSSKNDLQRGVISGAVDLSGIRLAVAGVGSSRKGRIT
ncbi:WD repeat-containing protein 91 [Taenia solium]|eukprot:TsM_000160100 transcript=TsM_000160100 gene=TsM_000160100